MAYESKTLKPVTAAICMALATGLGASASAVADSNPFSVADLDAGYQLAGEKGKEGKCGEGKCGGDKAKAKGKEGACGEKHRKDHEGKCGGDQRANSEKGKEGACGEKNKDKEGSCGGMA
ncbi:MAG: hypothetical protein PVF46_06355 [Lysobacterales bacterium]